MSSPVPPVEVRIEGRVDQSVAAAVAALVQAMQAADAQARRTGDGARDMGQGFGAATQQAQGLQRGLQAGARQQQLMAVATQRNTGFLTQLGLASGNTRAGLGKITSAAASTAIALTGTSGAVGTLINGLLLFAGGVGWVLKIAVAVLAMAGAWRLWTKDARKARQESDDLISSLESQQKAAAQTEDAAGDAARQRLVEARRQLMAIDESESFASGASFASSFVRGILSVWQKFKLKREITKLEPLVEFADDDRAKRIGAARRGVEREAVQQELSRAEAHDRELAQQNERTYEAGLQSLRQYHESRLGLIEQATAREVAALQKERGIVAATPVKTAEDGIRRSGELAQLDARIARVREEGDQKRAEALAKYQAEAGALAKDLLGFEGQLQDARGQTHEARLREIEQEAAAFDRTLSQQGIDRAGRQPRVDAYRAALQQQAEIERLGQEADRIFAELATERQLIADQVARGQLSELQGNRALAAVEKERLPKLQEIADAMLKFALILGNPELIANAKKLQAALKGLGDTTRSLKADFRDSFEQSLSTFLGDTINDVESVGEAFRALVLDILQGFQRIVAARIAAEIASAVFGFSEGGPVPGFATGGRVPGTGSGDTVRAMLTPEEFVEPVHAVRHYGVGVFEAMRRHQVPRELFQGIDGLNRTVRPAATGGHFNMGGLVGSGEPAAAGAPVSFEAMLGLDEGLFVHKVRGIVRQEIVGSRKLLRATIAGGRKR